MAAMVAARFRYAVACALGTQGRDELAGAACDTWDRWAQAGMPWRRTAWALLWAHHYAVCCPLRWLGRRV